MNREPDGFTVKLTREQYNRLTDDAKASKSFAVRTLLDAGRFDGDLFISDVSRRVLFSALEDLILKAPNSHVIDSLVETGEAYDAAFRGHMESERGSPALSGD